MSSAASYPAQVVPHPQGGALLQPGNRAPSPTPLTERRWTLAMIPMEPPANVRGRRALPLPTGDFNAPAHPPSSFTRAQPTPMSGEGQTHQPRQSPHVRKRCSGARLTTIPRRTHYSRALPSHRSFRRRACFDVYGTTVHFGRMKRWNVEKKMSNLLSGGTFRDFPRIACSPTWPSPLASIRDIRDGLLGEFPEIPCNGNCILMECESLETKRIVDMEGITLSYSNELYPGPPRMMRQTPGHPSLTFRGLAPASERPAPMQCLEAPSRRPRTPGSHCPFRSAQARRGLGINAPTPAAAQPGPSPDAGGDASRYISPHALTTVQMGLRLWTVSLLPLDSSHPKKRAAHTFDEPQRSRGSCPGEDEGGAKAGGARDA
jgi:hypothetical protein